MTKATKATKAQEQTTWETLTKKCSSLSGEVRAVLAECPSYVDAVERVRDAFAEFLPEAKVQEAVEGLMAALRDGAEKVKYTYTTAEEQRTSDEATREVTRWILAAEQQKNPWLVEAVRSLNAAVEASFSEDFSEKFTANAWAKGGKERIYCAWNKHGGYNRSVEWWVSPMEKDGKAQVTAGAKNVTDEIQKAIAMSEKAAQY